jgi:hypothetical protein
MKKTFFSLIFLVFAIGTQAQDRNLDSLIEANVFKLTYTKMINHESIWFNGKKYAVIGIYCLFKDDDGKTIYRKINSVGTLDENHVLFRFSELYLSPYATAPAVSTDFDDSIVIEMTDLIRSERIIVSGNVAEMPLMKYHKEYFYQTIEVPYYIYKDGFYSHKIFKYKIEENSIKKISVSKKILKIQLKNGDILKIDKTSFLWNNGITL